MYTNAQSILKKMDELRSYAADRDPDIIMLTETWTNETIGDDFLKISGYEMVARNDREDTAGGRGGGILVYAKKEITCWREEGACEFNQRVSVRIRLDKKSEMGMHCIYRSPNSSRQNDEALCRWIESLEENKMLIGDFNLPGIRWEEGRSDAKGREFHRTCNDKFLEQHVKEATHINGNRLDLVLTDGGDKVREIVMDGRLDRSDHEIVVVKMARNNESQSMDRRYRNFRGAKYGGARAKIAGIDWDKELEGKNVEEMWKEIKETLEMVIEENVPWRKIQEKVKPKWYNKEVERLIRSKRKAWNQWKKTKKVEDKEEYKRLERESKGMIRRRKKGLEKTIAKEAKQNPKAYYAYINSQKNIRSKVGPLRTEEGGESVMVVESREQAAVLNRFFSSVFTRTGGDIPEKEKEPGTPEMTSVDLGEERVKETIQRLREDSAPGPDLIPNKLLIETVNEISRPLAILFEKSLRERRIPGDWRSAKVTPIFKKGSKAVPGNYRPVSLTSATCKLMERIVKEDIEMHVERNGLLKPSQHGFRQGRSPQTNLIEFMEQTTIWMDEGRSFDVIYLDFAKAFDVVCHKRLMVKLKAKGIDGDLLEWIRDWLAGRKQWVVVEGEESDWADVLSGVVQGSVLGGIFFTIFIDDLDELIRALIKKFADDTKMTRIVEDDEQAEEMQRDLDRVDAWAKSWGMKFNVSKCKVMHVGRRNRKYEYEMSGEKLEEVVEERDLGVWTSNSMKPAIQCERAAKSANRALGMMLRAFHYRTKETLIPLYKTFVRPILEFGGAAWCPWTAKDEETLEVVQKRLIRALSDCHGETYEERVKRAGLTTLKERRVRGDVIEAFKTLRGFNKVKKEEWFDIRSSEVTRPTRGNTVVRDGTEMKKVETLYKKPARSEIRNNFYTVRVTRLWNELPEEVKNAQSVNAFKTAYDTWKTKEGNNLIT